MIPRCSQNPISLGRPIEVTYPPWRCPHCGRRIKTYRGPDTKWQEWWYTVEDNRRHYKRYCNIMADAMVAFRRMMGVVP